MVFDNNDDFGIDSFRQDASYIFDANSTTVQIIRHNKDKAGKNLQGDFLGIKTPTFQDTKEFIDINIMSTNSERRLQEKEGYTGKGEIRYTCFASHDAEINHKDLIVFIEHYRYKNQTIKAGDKFRIEMQDFGPFKGQYCFKNFELVKI